MIIVNIGFFLLFYKKQESIRNNNKKLNDQTELKPIIGTKNNLFLYIVDQTIIKLILKIIIRVINKK